MVQHDLAQSADLRVNVEHELSPFGVGGAGVAIMSG
jgi:hypothetical protein